MMNKLDSVGLGGAILNIRQGFALTKSEMADTGNADKFYQLMQSEIAQRQNTIDSLESVLKLHTQFSDESVEISPEVKVLFPTVRDLALSRMVASSVRGEDRDTIQIIFVNAPGGLTQSERKKLTDYIEVRLGRKIFT